MPDFRNTRPISQTERWYGSPNIPRMPGKSKFAEGRLNAGMITMLDPADIPTGALQIARNARVRFDKTQRRPGTILMTPTKPDSNPVLGTFFFKKNNGETFFFRFTPSTIYSRDPGSWTAITSAAAVKATGILTGTSNFADAETVTIGAKTYTFQTVLTNVDGHVFIGATLAASLTNLKEAINLGSGSGTDYAAATTAHPTVIATTLTSTQLTVEAITAGSAGNSIVETTTASNATWNNPTLTGGADSGSIAGSVTDRFQSVVAFDRFVFSNNGVDVIQEIDTSALTYKPLGNAPAYKYITGFYNRIVGANLGGLFPNGVQIGWSAEGGITGVGLEEWDPLVDESAGSSPLVDSPSDLADYITGLFGFTNVMIVLREQSIWLGSKQPIPTNPFNFYNAFPGLGCDAPDSAVITLNGVTWVDTRSGTVWMYTPGGQPEPIGRAIEADLMRGLSDPAQIFASYAPIENEYTVCIPQTGSGYVICWTYNFRTQAWVRDEYEAITSIDDVDLATAVTTIDDLVGIIDGLEGTIDDLSPTQEVIPTRVFGRSDGEIIVEDRAPDDSTTSDTDPITADPLSTGVYETELLSKSYTLPTDDMYVAEIRIEYLPLRAGNLKLEYSRDGGRTISTLYKEITTENIGVAQIFRWTKQIKARRFAWRLTSTSGQFQILGYEVHVYEGAESNS